MRNRKVSTAVVLIFILAGCVPSLHELYTEDTVIFDEKLIGCWGEGDEMWCFTRHGKDDAYDLIITEDEDKRSFLYAVLTDVKGQMFLDLYPQEKVEMCTGDWYKFHLLPVHTFIKVDATDPNLVIAAMNPDNLKELLAEKPDLVKHETVDDGPRVVLTASPRELQAFLSNNQVVETIFPESETMPRRKPQE